MPTVLVKGLASYLDRQIGKWVVIDKTGNEVDGLPKADYYSIKKEGLILQLLEGEMSYLDEDGETIIADNYTFATDFFEGHAAVSRNEPRTRGTIWSYQYSNKLSQARGSYQIIDRTGTPINDVYYLGVPKFFQGGVAKVNLLTEDGRQEYTALIDLKDGGRIFDIDEPYLFSRNYIIDETTTRYSPE
jgi:hypothetical protein